MDKKGLITIVICAILVLALMIIARLIAPGDPAAGYRPDPSAIARAAGASFNAFTRP